MILSGADNRPPMLDKDMYDSWKRRMDLYMQNREHGRMILESVKHGPLIWPTVKENGVIRTKKYDELYAAKNSKVAKDLWERVQLLMQGFVVPVFSPGDDPIACLNKSMAFLIVVASSRFPSTNNQLKTSSNPRTKATIKTAGNAAWYKEKDMLAKAQEARQILDEEQLAFLADPRILVGQAQTIIPHNATFQTEDLDTYDSDCDDLSTAQAVLMANISNYGSNVISEATVQDTNLQAQQDSMILSVIEQMSEQMINHVNNWEKANKEQNNETITAELERYKERVKNFEQRLNIDLSSLFKNESREKENKYMENEIDLEKKIKELDNIICKVGQSAQTVHMLTKPQAFYDNTHKQALEYFEINDLKARLQDKDKTICKLKDAIQSLRENTKEENVNHDKCDHEPINKKLENSVAKLPSENECLCNEINHVKQVFKDQFDSIKQTCVRYKEQWKEIVENVIHIPSITTIAPGMFKLDLVPLPPRLLQNRELDFACKYATRIQELLVYVQDTCPIAVTPSTKKVESSNTSDSNTHVLSSTGVNYFTNYGSKPLGNKKNDRISQTPSRNKKNKVEAQLRKVNKTNHVVKPICDVDVKHSLSNANSKILCATCNKSMFDGVHDKCFLDLVQNGNKCSSKIAKIVESKNANHSEPNQTWGSNATDIPSSSSLVMIGCPDCTLVSELWMFETHDRESLSAQEL
ncbi:hypothetical protein Tco_1221330, partial [Tanacetum coccineum]